ncbi:hypothetical protein TWF106_010264 [Orbilia oligospora]|uniref:BTB domain-containing protein n=1 Tax=Orbilia oligospora TaxID=2813651 RepID=A0A6G1MD42_ORBOL|nr:hypothetical protein TWF788_010810 [Orbilia oligospora]KAF3203736.1 hypothetical protein TWF679_010089 [Orbilia oligospora]KAF3211380.1 hypothetical protein TWF106_010264 [Orbilia oligospora]KAF3219210.1 hypothetical protein TWF191_008003 [Orbilia oligospora]KAF3251814.1 hypothetical protein TWF192_004772 [Orbilia oligospora]
MAASVPPATNAGNATNGLNSNQILASTPTASNAQTSQNFSSLVSRVLSTSGKEPPSLVGSSTTIVGDHLYVFGGRILSKNRPQLTSDMYLLNLLTRAWSKVEQFGEIPAPRYFHSVCALGDTKLVCFGGMSPAGGNAVDGIPQPPQGENGANEVVVMSDIHIFDIQTRTWSYVPQAEPPEGRYAHCATILPTSAVFSTLTGVAAAFDSGVIDGTGGAEMIIVGGQDSANHYIEEINVFNLRSLKWTSTNSLDRSCGAYRSVVTPLGPTLSPEAIGAGRPEADAEGEAARAVTPSDTNAMLIYSNYNFLDVKLELQIRYHDGKLVEKPMNGLVSPPGLRFPNGGVIDSHFVVSGTYLTSSKQEYALWALDLRTLTWSRIDAGQVFSQGSWNRGILWKKRNRFIILGNKQRSLVEDYNHRRINSSHLCMVELEAFGIYENPRKSLQYPGPKNFSKQAQELGRLVLGLKDMADMEFLSIDNASIPVNSRIIARRWGPYFIELLHTATTPHQPNSGDKVARPQSPSLLESPPSANMLPPFSRPRTLYLPHTHQTLLTLVHWFYTCSLPQANHPQSSPQVLCSLLQIARAYRIEGLLEAVVERLHQVLDSRNAAAVFNAAAMAAGGGAALRLKKLNLLGDADGIKLKKANNIGDVPDVNGDANHHSPASDGPILEEGELGGDDEAWDGRGGVSPVVGLQKRGLRGLMDSRRVRERGRSMGANAMMGSAGGSASNQGGQQPAGQGQVQTPVSATIGPSPLGHNQSNIGISGFFGAG